jgi:RNA recognition motif-containing protein
MILQLGRSKGFCFIEYDTPAGAEAAQAMNNFELAGRNVRKISL